MNIRWLGLLGLGACGDPDTECAVSDEVIAWIDADGDGAGDPATLVWVCAPGAGQVSNDDDCDDGDPDIAPSSVEQCDGIDQDCDGDIDEGLTFDRWFADGDGDGFGAGTGVDGCAQPPNTSNDGTDCDDSDDQVFPDAVEVCDSVDNDCDSATDDADPGLDFSTTTTFYRDLDGDGYGDEGASALACASPDPERFIETAGDCNDNDRDRNPGANEVCDRIDNNCDQLVDEDDPLLDPSTLADLFVDADRDGFGDDTQPIEACFPSPGESPFGGDCDDSNPLVFDAPNWILDADADGFGAGAVVGTSCTIPVPGSVIDAGPRDCNDSDPAVSPLALEICDTIDNDCDGQTDDADPDLDPSGAQTFYVDRDQDGFGGAGSIVACNPNPANYTLVPGDCDDRDALSFPGNPEVCDGSDNDCDLLFDTDDPTLDPTTLGTFYEDLDLDGVGVTPILACDVSPGIADVDGDCDDTDPTLLGPSLWLVDGDGDGVGAGAVLGPEACFAPQPDSVPQIDAGDDCLDTDPTIFPGAFDSCADGIDQDCDGIDPGCLVGSYEVGDGPSWVNNPPVYSCLDACALLFGGVATDYQCSTSDFVVDNQSFVSGWGDPQYCAVPVAETFVREDAMNPGYDCGMFGCSYSAYVLDHCSVGQSRNYCWAR